jgi:hypothetical protein
MWKNRHKISLVSVSVLVFGSILFPTPALAVEPVPVIQLVSVSASSDTYLVGAAVTINMSLQVASGQSYSGVISAWVCEVGVTPCVEKGIRSSGLFDKSGTFSIEVTRSTLLVGNYYLNRIVISDAFGEDLAGDLHYLLLADYPRLGETNLTKITKVDLSSVTFSILASIPEPVVIAPTQDDTEVIDDTVTIDDSLISDETVLVDDTPVLDDTTTVDDSIHLDDTNLIDDTNILVIEDTTIDLGDSVSDETLIVDDSVPIDDTLVIDETVIIDEPRVVEQPTEVQSTPAPTESTPTPESPPVAQQQPEQQAEPPAAVTAPVTTVIETQIVAPVVLKEPELKPIETKDDTVEVVVETITLEKTPEVIINVEPWLPAKSRDSKVALGGQVTAIKGAGSQLQRWVDQGSGSLIFERSTQGAKVQIYLGDELIGEHSLFGHRSRTVFSWNRQVFKSKQVLTIKTLTGPKGSSVRLDAIEINGRLLLNPKFMMQIGPIQE